MISRIFSEMLEDSSYPLSSSGSVYPNGLIQSISITLPKECTVYIESITVTESVVSVILTSDDGSGNRNPLGSGILAKSLGNLAVIHHEDTGDPIGFIVLGSLIDIPRQYVGTVQVLDSCIHIAKSMDATICVNGSKHKTPTSLNILINGDLDVKYIEPADENSIGQFTIYNKFKEASQLLDADSLDISGGIVSVNNVMSTTGTVTIKMPDYTLDESSSESSAVVPLLQIDSESSPDSDYVVITISNNPDADTSRFSVFSCPNSDILLDRIVSDNIDVSPVETPLDAFIKWYSGDESSSSVSS